MTLRTMTFAPAAILSAAMLLAAVRPASAQYHSKPKSMTLWVDPASGQLFTRPGKGRKPFVIPSAGLDTGEIENRVEQKVEQKTQQNLEQTEQEMKADLARTQQQNQELSQQLAEIRPVWKDYVDNFKNKFRLGTLVYADYRFYSHTGFGPQELTQINQPGPQNNAFNTFDISRAYINLFFNPTDDWTIRVTPNIYRTNGTASADSFGQNSSIGSNLSDNLGYRLKYGFLQYGKAFDQIEPMKGDTITIGQEPNPLVAWEEDLYGFRYVNLTPWNYLSLSSTQQGLSVQGPIKFGGLQYIDYDFGVYNDATFHQFEQADTKQGMARVSFYPMGAKWRFDGLGLTGFFDYGYSNVAPDEVLTTVASKHVVRVAGLVHYTAEQWGLAGEWDWGRNAFTASNLFSGSGPASTSSAFKNYSALTTAFQNNGKSTQTGFDFFGHAHIPETPFTVFGLFEMFEPNTKVDVNPNDFQRFVAGINYQYNEFLRLAFASQNLLYYHNQFTVPGSEVAHFGGPATAVADAVQRDNHMFFLGAEFSY